MKQAFIELEFRFLNAFRFKLESTRSSFTSCLDKCATLTGGASCLKSPVKNKRVKWCAAVASQSRQKQSRPALPGQRKKTTAPASQQGRPSDDDEVAALPMFKMGVNRTGSHLDAR